jgi:hypothetical protein
VSWDVHGQPLQPGHCEVHPTVSAPYPCPVCLAETHARLNDEERHQLALLQDELGLVDAVLRGFEDRRVDRDALYTLEPWRAAAMAKLGCRAGVVTQFERDEIVRQVQVGVRPLRVPGRLR